MSGGQVAAGVMQGVGQTLGAASGPVSAAINARMYKKYGLHEPEYLAASQRAAGINPLVAESGSLPAPPDLGFGMEFHPEKAITTAQEVKKAQYENAILKEGSEKARNENASSMQRLKMDTYAAQIMEDYGVKSKLADLKLTSATAAKLAQEAELLKRKIPEADADAKFWDNLNDSDAGDLMKALKFGIQTIKGK